jgi:hypothetical protein
LVNGFKFLEERYEEMLFGFFGMWLLSLRHLWCLKGYWCWYDDVFERILKGGGEVEVEVDEDEVVEEVKKL